MNLRPADHLTEEQIDKGLKNVVWDGVLTEAMSTLTGGAFLVALALKLGASNFLIGLLAALPTIAMIFQLAAIYMVSKYKNRRLIAVMCSLFARVPLLMIGVFSLLLPPMGALAMITIVLFFHYFFGSVTGVTWNSWMKDLIPEERMGMFFSARTRKIQMVTVSSSLLAALALDIVKNRYPQYEQYTYSGMFIVGGLFGLASIYMLANTPEPRMLVTQETNVLKLFRNPIKDTNFRNLIIFNAFWAFAINLASPFFAVYLLKELHMKFIFIIGLNTLSTLCSILFVKMWGGLADRYSNKTIILYCGPIYLVCLILWTFTTLPNPHRFTIPLLIVIYIFTGISTAGINLSIVNLGLKLASRSEAMTYMTTRGIITAAFSAVAPLVGGWCADYFTGRRLSFTFQWQGPHGLVNIPALSLESWDFFFVLAVIIAVFSLYRLGFVEEKGEAAKSVLRKELRAQLRQRVKVLQGVAGLNWVSMRSFGFTQGAKPISNVPRIGIQSSNMPKLSELPQARPNSEDGEPEVWVAIGD